MGCLYSIESPNGKRYIGITSKTAEQRWQSHKRACASGRKHALYHAIRKYGSDAFRVSTLVIADGRGYLSELEKRAIEVYGTKSPNGYNLTDGGEGIVGYVWTDEDLSAISAAQKTRYSRKDQREKLVAQARIANEAMRAAAASRRINGKPPHVARSEASRSRMGSVERSLKISEAVKKAMSRPEARERFLEACAKRDKSRLSENGKRNLGRKHGPASEERKQKIRQRQIAAWADPVRREKRLASMAASRALRLKHPEGSA